MTSSSAVGDGRRRAVMRLGGEMMAVTATAMVAAVMPVGALAQSVTPGSVVYLETVTIEGKRETPEGLARQRLEAIPGGTALVTAEQLEGKAVVGVGDALSGVPGVVVQGFFGGNDQPRVEIRGSGMQQNPAQRGLLALQDGLPINRADGSYIVGFAAPRQADRIEVYRGYASNRLGATVLGGALNFVSPTGSSTPGAAASFEGGSYGQINATAQVGGQMDNLDALVMVDRSQRDGYRNYNSSDRTGFSANAGAKLSDVVTTRLYAGYTDLAFDIPGPIPKSVMENQPKSVGVGINILRDQPRRDATQFRLGDRTTAALGDHILDVAAGYTRTDDEFRAPVSAGVQVTGGDDFTAVVRHAYAPDASQPLPLIETSVRYVVGNADREYYHNKRGGRGALFGRNELDATTLAANTGANLPFAEKFTLSPSLAFAYATRDNKDQLGAAARATYNASTGAVGSTAGRDTSYSREYAGFAPSLALSYRPIQNHMVFGAVSRNFEPPSHDDLLGTSGGTANSGPTSFVTKDIKAQTGTTIEAGWRGQAGIVGIDVVGYHSWLEKEILSLRDSTGASLGAFNADRTRHLGAEVGGTAQLTEQLGVRLAYTYQDFRFDDDPVRGNRRLAGAPSHQVNTVVQYDLTPAWTTQAEVAWVPVKTPVDNMNTLWADPYATVAMRSSYAVTEKIKVYGEVRNLLDKTYTTATQIVDQASSSAQPAFLPADGRSFFAGIKAKF
ncbi:TonB-dependent receptor [Magnetospirillum sp. 15-1]|uniref:TonB-dependent receptor family protein n=1 Tax=Magnetospirillum sp. 15-1 TaxID=1979370 RepID=UPI0018D50C63|nr:TonB-dependent receptor [Magnetospirillum sp. 15-1]